jgi:hypothetical protein
MPGKYDPKIHRILAGIGHLFGKGALESASLVSCYEWLKQADKKQTNTTENN